MGFDETNPLNAVPNAAVYANIARLFHNNSTL